MKTTTATTITTAASSPMPSLSWRAALIRLAWDNPGGVRGELLPIILNMEGEAAASSRQQKEGKNKAKDRRKQYEKARNKAKNKAKPKKKRKELPSYDEFIDTTKVKNPDNPEGGLVTLRTLKTKDKDSQAYKVYQQYVEKRQQAVDKERLRKVVVTGPRPGGEPEKPGGDAKSLRKDVEDKVKQKVLDAVGEELSEEIAEKITDEVVDEVKEVLGEGGDNKQGLKELSKEAAGAAKEKGIEFLKGKGGKVKKSLMGFLTKGGGDLGDLAAMVASFFLILVDSNAGQQMLDRILEDIAPEEEGDTGASSATGEAALKALSEVKVAELREMLSDRSNQELKDILGISVGKGDEDSGVTIDADKLIAALEEEGPLDDEIIEALTKFFSNIHDGHIELLRKYIDPHTGDIDIEALRKALRAGPPTKNKGEGDKDKDGGGDDDKEDYPFPDLKFDDDKDAGMMRRVATRWLRLRGASHRVAIRFSQGGVRGGG